LTLYCRKKVKLFSATTASYLPSNRETEPLQFFQRLSRTAKRSVDIKSK
jgi:hypothetical protein